MEKKLAVYVGQQIRELRKQKKLTQGELANMLNKSVSRISNYESGKAAPHQDTLFELSRIFGCSIDDFFPATSSPTRLDDVLRFNTNNFSFKDVAFLRQLIDYTESLQVTERQELLNDINSVVERFRQKR